MSHLPTLADRVWHALHCLPRKKGNPRGPSYRALEAKHGLANATFSRAINGTVENPSPATLMGLAKALNVTAEWLWHGTGRTPTPVVPVPRRQESDVAHAEIEGWAEAVEEALAERPRMVPPEAFDAAAELVVLRPLGTITPRIALAAALYAWEIATPAERKRYAAARRRRPPTRKPRARKVTSRSA